MKNNVNRIGGLVLAGGKSRRMNFNDKSFKKIGDTSLIEIVIKRLKPQVSTIAINSNTMDNNRKFNDDTISHFKLGSTANFSTIQKKLLSEFELKELNLIFKKYQSELIKIG